LGGQRVCRLLCSAASGERIVRVRRAMFARCAGTRLKRWIIEDRVLNTESDSRIKRQRPLDDSRWLKRAEEEWVVPRATVANRTSTPTTVLQLYQILRHPRIPVDIGVAMCLLRGRRGVRDVVVGGG
jgi:hypothetical protein